MNSWFFCFNSSFLEWLSCFYAAELQRSDILADCHIGGTDEQKAFLWFLFPLLQNVKTS